MESDRLKDPADANGNRTGRTVNGTAETAVYDDADKLLNVTVGGSTVRSYVYDGAGRATSVTAGGSTTNLGWDSRGYAVSVGGTAMGVNGAGARTVEGGQALLRDGADVLAPVLADGAATYVPGVSERRSGNTTYVHGGDKNAEARTNASGSVSGTRSYDAFGAVLTTGGTWQGPSGYGGAFGYREDGTTFRLVGHRLYDPTAGRFLSRDPARDGSNWYAYCGGDPVNGADPEGLGHLPIIIPGKLGLKIRLDLNEMPVPDAHLIRPGRKPATLINANGDIPPMHGGKPNPPLTPPERKELKEWGGMWEHVVAKLVDAADNRVLPGTASKALNIFGLAILVGQLAGPIIDPYVQDTRNGFNKLARERWVEEEEAALLRHGA